MQVPRLHHDLQLHVITAAGVFPRRRSVSSMKYPTCYQVGIGLEVQPFSASVVHPLVSVQARSHLTAVAVFGI